MDYSAPDERAINASTDPTSCMDADTAFEKDTDSPLTVFESETNERESESNNIDGKTIEIDRESNEIESEIIEIKTDTNEIESESNEIESETNEKESEPNGIESESDLSRQKTGEKLLKETLKQFNKYRCILLSDIPRATYEEIREYFEDYGVADITINHKMQSATVQLRHGSEAEEISLHLQGKPLLGENIGVSVRPNYNMLCVAHLPFSMTDATLASFAAQMGIVERCFLMRSEKTGQSKGYGFIEFAHNRDHTNTIRLKIDRKLVGGSVVHCDFVASHLTSYCQLHSQCLLLNNLPGDATDQALVEACSKVAPPAFLKTGIVNENCVGFAIVQCRTSQETEELQTFLHGRQVFKDRHVSATYCLPGITGAELFDKLMTMRMKAQSPVQQSQQQYSQSMNQKFAGNPALQNLFQQLQVLQQNFQYILQGGANKPQNYYNNRGPGFNNMSLPPTGGVSNPMNNPMIQQAISLLVMSMQNQNPVQQQQFQQMMPMMNQMLAQQARNLNNPRMPVNQQQNNPVAQHPHQSSQQHHQAPPPNHMIQNVMSHIRQINHSPTPTNQRPPYPNQPIRHPHPPPRPPPLMPPQQPPPSSQQPTTTSQLMPPPQQPPPHRHPVANNQTNKPAYVNQRNSPQQQNPQQLQQNLMQSLQPLMNNLQSLIGNLQQQHQPHPSQQQAYPNMSQPPNIQGQFLIQTIMSSVMGTLTNLMRGQNPQQLASIQGQGPPPRMTSPSTSTQNGGPTRQPKADLRPVKSHNTKDTTVSTPKCVEAFCVTSSDVEQDDVTPDGETERQKMEKVPIEAEQDAEKSVLTPDDEKMKKSSSEQEEGDAEEEDEDKDEDEGQCEGQGQGEGDVDGDGDGQGEGECSYPAGGKPTDESFDISTKQIADYGALIRDCYGETRYVQFLSLADDLKAEQASQWANRSPSDSAWVDHEALKRIFNGEQSTEETPTGMIEDTATSLDEATSSKDEETSSEEQVAASSDVGTPANQALKRSASYSLPDPEPSPEGDYVGLHSQGIGGHYADSYIKRKRLL